jgi:predicted GIY-YIG superfamily endonuclease
MNTGIVYLIRLERKLSNHAQYYIGFTSKTPTERLDTHRSGQGSKMLAEATRRGIKYNIVRVWTEKTRAFERSLKNRKNAKLLCPIYNDNLSTELFINHTH